MRLESSWTPQLGFLELALASHWAELGTPTPPHCTHRALGEGTAVPGPVLLEHSPQGHIGNTDTLLLVL